MDGSLQGIREVRGNKVFWRIGQDNMTDSVLLFELDDLHFKPSFKVQML
jgi:hypothetical protein